MTWDMILSISEDALSKFKPVIRDPGKIRERRADKPPVMTGKE
jgi:hypothetical protein